MLTRLGIRQKLVALAALPMIAVLLTMTPFIVERIRDAGLATATADAAGTARDVDVLLQDLQTERLLALAFLSSPQVDRTALIAQIATSQADAARLRVDPATAPVVNQAERSMSSLNASRGLFIARTVSAETAYQTYRRAIGDLIDNLTLTNPVGVDVTGIRQLQTLDELTRANEEAASLGATLVAVAGDVRFPVDLVNEAVTAQAQHTDRLATLVQPDQAQLLDLLESGRAGDRITQLIATVNRTDRGTADVDVADALSAASSYTTLRQVAQDRITRDVTTSATSRAISAQRVAAGVGVIGLLLVVLVFWLARTISRSISRPLRRLTRAATDVAALAERQLVRIADTDADDSTPIHLADVDIASPDEIGELAAAFNRVQATAAALVEQQVNSRRNVGVMFANIARRTQNLVGHQRGQLQTLRRFITDPRALEQLNRLDQQRSQLRRSADSLLVVSGIVDQGAGGTPALLADVIAGVCADLGPDADIRQRMVAPITVTAGFVEDLRLILGELLANAVGFAPPGSYTELTAELRDELTISIVDHGLGLTDTRLAEENRRLVERERLDVMPTSVLGLFVVGRLARRYGLAVWLEHTAGGGLTARVTVPVRLLGPASAVDVVRRPSGTPGVTVALRDGWPDSFDWFGVGALTRELPTLSNTTAPALPAPAVPQPALPATALLAPTVPLSALPPAWPPATSPVPPPIPLQRPAPAAPLPLPAAAPTPTSQAAAPPLTIGGIPGPPAPTRPVNGASVNGNGSPVGERRGGLTRRRPGQHLAPGLLSAGAREPVREQRRDPAAERAQLDSLLAGFERGETSQQPPVPSEPHVERPS